MMSTATQLAIAVVVGTVLGLGLWSMFAAIPRWRAQPLIQRVAPYVRDITDPDGTSLPTVMPTDPAAFLIVGARRAFKETVSLGSRLWGISDALVSRIGRAGWHVTAAQFRERQLIAIVVGALGGGLLALVARSVGNSSPGLLMLPVLFAGAAVIGSEYLLSRAASARRARLEDELPTILEFLALCLSAGEGLLDAIRRTAGVGVGDLSQELKQVLLHVNTGTPLAESLVSFARRVDVPTVTRAVEHVVAAIDRGAPLAAVLKDQAADARTEQKRALMERAGKNEVFMLVPLVFLILPLSVVIAIFPGIAMLNLGR